MTTAEAILFFALAMIPSMLTIAMFVSKNMMLGFPSGMFWALFGGYSYGFSSALWDIYYLLAFASMLGMTVFTIYAAYGLRKSDLSDMKEGKYLFDKAHIKANASVEDNEETDTSEPEPPAPLSPRTKAIRERARRRRSGVKDDKGWGQYR